MGPPLDEEDPTGEQLRALHYKVSECNGPPYVDFAIWGPFNRKVARSLKFTAWIPQADGSFLKKEVPGPANLASWKSSWGVFRVACIMLQCVVEIALSKYCKNFERLAIITTSPNDIAPRDGCLGLACKNT